MKKIYRSPIFSIRNIDKTDVLTASLGGFNDIDNLGLGEMEL